MNGKRICTEFKSETLEEMDKLITRGLFTTRTEVVKAGIREILKEYKGDKIEQVKQ